MPLAVQLEDLGHDPVEEIAVVADDQHRLGLLDEVILEPAGGVDVEVVARLVEEHHVRARPAAAWRASAGSAGRR